MSSVRLLLGPLEFWWIPTQSSSQLTGPTLIPKRGPWSQGTQGPVSQAQGACKTLSQPSASESSALSLGLSVSTALWYWGFGWVFRWVTCQGVLTQHPSGAPGTPPDLSGSFPEQQASNCPWAAGEIPTTNKASGQ